MTILKKMRSTTLRERLPPTVYCEIYFNLFSFHLVGAYLVVFMEMRFALNKLCVPYAPTQRMGMRAKSEWMVSVGKFN